MDRGTSLLERNASRSATGIDHLERFAWLMDRAIRVPGTKIRVGLDSVLGLLPFAGDAATGLLQAGLVLVAVTRYKVPKVVAIRMIVNVLLDMGIGAIPIVGDLFDVAFKANTRNLSLLREAHDAEIRHASMSATSSRRYLIGLAIAFLVAIALFVAALVALFLWAFAVLMGHPIL